MKKDKITMNFIHDKQKKVWEKEHSNPSILLQMDQEEASSGVKKFFLWLSQNNYLSDLKGIEMGCGKGRNSIWLANQGFIMSAFDFSESAITVAGKRAKKADADVNFSIHDATKQWPYGNSCFDFAIDCFASTDIESPEGRAFARDEFERVLKPGGFLLVYTLSTDDEFHKEMLEKHPAEEKNSFIHPTNGKFEKVFDREELLDFYKGFNWIEEQRVEKEADFFGEKYFCKHFWIVLKKK